MRKNDPRRPQQTTIDAAVEAMPTPFRNEDLRKALGMGAFDASEEISRLHKEGRIIPVDDGVRQWRRAPGDALETSGAMSGAMSGREFAALARCILDRHAHPDPNGRTYMDDTVSISENHLGLRLCIVRLAKDVDEPGMRRPNATTIVDETGLVIRHHAEHEMLVDHMVSLAGRPADIIFQNPQ